MKYPEINKKTKEYWREDDFNQLKKVKSFTEMFSIAKIILSRMPANLGQVCGPITNGGLGSKEENLRYLNEAIDSLQKAGVDIFDQIPFEETIHRLFDDVSLQQKQETLSYY